MIMKFRQPTLHLLILLAALSLGASAADGRRVFRAGAATSNITPQIGGGIVGGFTPIPSTHVHDELHARCLVLDDGTNRLAIVVCDLLGASRNVYDEARRLVEKETGIPGAHLLMSSTHTHSAISAMGNDRFLWNQELDQYQTFVARRIADGVRRAVNNLMPAQAGWTTAQAPQHVFNRRWFMTPGTIAPNPFGETDQVKMNPARGSPNLVEPAGPTDPEICILAFRTPEGRPIALLANYSLHYVGGVGGGHISADYYGMFCDRIQQLLGADRLDPPFVALLSNGTSGNINNINFREAAKPQPPYSRMREVAGDVAKTVQEAVRMMAYHDWVPLAGRSRELTVKARHPTSAQLEHAKGVTSKPRPANRAATLEEIYAERTLRMAEYPPEISLPIQVLRVGEVGIGSIPCETFVETGLEWKRRSKLKPGFITSIAHGYYGYLPTEEHHKLGGYETWLGTNRLEPRAATLILEALLALQAELP
jgi:neutral ceramidase